MSNVFEPGLSATLQSVLKNFLSSLHFAGGPSDANATTNGSANAVSLPKSKGKFNGIYRSIGVINYCKWRSSKDWMALRGFVSRRKIQGGVPRRGMDQLDEDAEIRRNPVGWGTYELSRDRGRIVFAITDPVHEKEPIIWDLKEYPDHLQIKGDTYNLLGVATG